MRTTRAEMEETNPASTCRSKTVRTATAMPSTVGHRCFSTSVQRRCGCVCSILPALLPFACVYTPWGYLYNGTLYPIRQGGVIIPPTPFTNLLEDVFSEGGRQPTRYRVAPTEGHR